MDVEPQPVPYRRIGTILVERGLITETQLTQALAEQRESGRLLGEIFVTGYGVSRMDLADVLAEQWDEARTATSASYRAETASAGTAAEGDLRELLEEAQAARAELTTRTEELARRLAVLEALVVGVTGALDELRDGTSQPPAHVRRRRSGRSGAASRPAAA